MKEKEKRNFSSYTERKKKPKKPSHALWKTRDFPHFEGLRAAEILKQQ